MSSAVQPDDLEISFKQTKFRSPEMETEKGIKDALEHHVKTLAKFEDLRSRNFRSRGKDLEGRKLRKDLVTLKQSAKQMNN
jgi:hypothetical protein